MTKKDIKAGTKFRFPNNPTVWLIHSVVEGDTVVYADAELYEAEAAHDWHWTTVDDVAATGEVV